MLNMKLIYALIVIYHSLHFGKFTQMTENKTEKANVVSGTNFNIKTFTVINSTRQRQIEFLQEMDEVLVQQITIPKQNSSFTILNNINEYNKVLKHILSKLLARSVLTRRRMLPTAEIVCTKLKPKFMSIPVKYVYTRNTFWWDDFDMRGLLALIKTTRDMWADMTQACELVRIQKFKKEKGNLHTPVSHKICTHH